MDVRGRLPGEDPCPGARKYLTVRFSCCFPGGGGGRCGREDTSQGAGHEERAGRGVEVVAGREGGIFGPRYCGAVLQRKP